MDKEQAIIRFKASCCRKENTEARKMAVESQYNRSAWDIVGRDGGLARIDLYKITVFGVVGSTPEDSVQQFDLTSEEYDELRDFYFGNFKPDVPYLQGIGALV